MNKMKFKILILLLLISNDVFGSYNLSQNRTSSYTCGKQYLHRKGHHLGGPQAGQGSFPWSAALIANDDFFCGGTLISNKEVVTAAHCIHDKSSEARFSPQDITVVLGYYDLKKRYESGRIAVDVKNIRLNPDWNPVTKSFDADIAILELNKTVEFTDFIQPICLIEPLSDVVSLTEGIVVGFEYSKIKGIANTPRVLDTPIISYHKCSLDFDYDYLLSPRTLCGGKADGTGACAGDGGSGLLVFKNKTFYLRGIVSATLNNFDGCNFDAYSIYTDAVKFYTWMKRTIS